jgi:hypothetical protein
MDCGIGYGKHPASEGFIMKLTTYTIIVALISFLAGMIVADCCHYYPIKRRNDMDTLFEKGDLYNNVGENQCERIERL